MSNVNWNVFLICSTLIGCSGSSGNSSNANSDPSIDNNGSGSDTQSQTLDYKGIYQSPEDLADFEDCLAAYTATLGAADDVDTLRTYFSNTNRMHHLEVFSTALDGDNLKIAYQYHYNSDTYKILHDNVSTYPDAAIVPPHFYIRQSRANAYRAPQPKRRYQSLCGQCYLSTSSR